MKLVLTYNIDGGYECGSYTQTLVFDTFNDKEQFLQFFKEALKIWIVRKTHNIIINITDPTCIKGYPYDIEVEPEEIMSLYTIDIIRNDGMLIDALTFKDFYFTLLELEEWFDAKMKEEI